MVALRNPKYILTISDYIMVEQNCVYERTMTVTYKRPDDYIENNQHYEVKREIIKQLYENKFPLVSAYTTSYENLDKSDYYPTKKTATSYEYNVTTNGEQIATTSYSSDAKMIVKAMEKFISANGLPEAKVQYEEIKITKEKVYEADMGYTILMPFALIDDTSEDYTYGRLDESMTILDKRYENDNYTTVNTRFMMGKYDAELKFIIQWDAHVKSTKADIEKQLVHMPELLTAKVINQVELLLKEHWKMIEDLTTIDCVTQSNINTKAACSPAVISSLKKRQAEL